MLIVSHDLLLLSCFAVVSERRAMPALTRAQSAQHRNTLAIVSFERCRRPRRFACLYCRAMPLTAWPPTRRHAAAMPRSAAARYVQLMPMSAAADTTPDVAITRRAMMSFRRAPAALLPPPLVARAVCLLLACCWLRHRRLFASAICTSRYTPAIDDAPARCAHAHVAGFSLLPAARFSIIFTFAIARPPATPITPADFSSPISRRRFHFRLTRAIYADRSFSMPLFFTPAFASPIFAMLRSSFEFPR